MTTAISTGNGSALTAADQAKAQAFFKKIKENMDNLSSALKSGDLAAAQSAYATIQQDKPAGPQRSGDPQRKDPMADLGTALAKGDISAAQQAFSTMQAGMKAHHRPDNDGDGAPPAGNPPEGTGSVLNAQG